MQQRTFKPLKDPWLCKCGEAKRERCLSLEVTTGQLEAPGHMHPKVTRAHTSLFIDHGVALALKGQALVLGLGRSK